VYDIAKANESLGFGRNKIIALALLCGSDYCDGVHGIGKESVVKLFNVVSEDEILKRLRSWKDRASYYGKLEAKIGDKSLCTLCGHSGRAQGHTKKGTVVGVNIFKRLIFFLKGVSNVGRVRGVILVNSKMRDWKSKMN
jgi:flap endonuclease GEN